MMERRSYSLTPSGPPRASGRRGKSYLLDGIPADLWRHAQRAAKADGLSMRTLILTLLAKWLNQRVPPKPRLPANPSDYR